MLARLLGIALAFATLAPTAAVVAQRDRLLVRVEHEPLRVPDAAPQVQVEVMRDGTFRRGEASGRLARRDLASMRRLVERARLRIDRRPLSVCAALPTHRVRITTARGRFVYPAPCAPPPHPTVLAVLARLDELTVPPPQSTSPPTDPDQVLFAYRERRNDTSVPVGLVLYADGRLTSEAGTVTLAPPDLERIVGRLRTVSLAPDPGVPPPCGARSIGVASVEIPAFGQIAWNMPCGGPNEALGSLLASLRRLAPQ